jgi:hypothetical protein
MSADRQGGTAAKRSRVSLFAIIGLALGVLALALPAVPALVTAAGGIILGVLGRRQFRRDPSTGPGWVSLAAIIVSGFVFVSQAVILSVVYFSA